LLWNAQASAIFLDDANLLGEYIKSAKTLFEFSKQVNLEINQIK
jgi:hypothetical protein